MTNSRHECPLCYIRSTVEDSFNRVGWVVDRKECEKGYCIYLCEICALGLRMATSYQLVSLMNRFRGDTKRLPDEIKSKLAMLRLVKQDDEIVINKDLGQLTKIGIALVLADLEERVSQSDGDPHA